MKNVLASQLMESLMSIAEKYFEGFDHAIFTPTSSIRVLSVMKNQKQQLLFMMLDYRVTPYTIPDQKTCYASKAFTEKLGGTIKKQKFT